MSRALKKLNQSYWIGCAAIVVAVESCGTNKSRAGDESYFLVILDLTLLGCIQKTKMVENEYNLSK